jgi:hypothetical protein
MPSFGSTGYAPDMRQWMGGGWMPERTYVTPRDDRQGSARGWHSARSSSGGISARQQQAEVVARQRRTPDPGPDILRGQRNGGDRYGGGARWDSTPNRDWDYDAPVSQRAAEPHRAVAPHRRPPKEVTGKVTGEHNSQENHRSLHSDRTVAPYRRDPTIAGKVSEAAHPAYRAETRFALYGRPAGVTSRDLVEHAVQAEHVANALDVEKAVTKSGSHAKFRNADAIDNIGIVPYDPTHEAGWDAAVRRHRAFDGAYGATTLEFNQQCASGSIRTLAQPA